MIRHAAFSIALLVAPAAFAQAYIVPDGDCGAIKLHVANTIDPDRVTSATVYLPKKKLAVTPAVGSGSLTFGATIPEEGVVMAAVAFKPVVHGNETRTEHAKTLIFCGATPPADWQRSTGLGIEIYPQGWNGPRPRMKPGDPMRFIAVDNATNKLIGDLPMELYRAGGDQIAEGVQAQNGGMTFPYPEPGRYMVVTTYRRPDPQQPEHILVDTSTLTFEIK
jgi:hypothetical protein